MQSFDDIKKTSKDFCIDGFIKTNYPKFKSVRKLNFLIWLNTKLMQHEQESSKIIHNLRV